MSGHLRTKWMTYGAELARNYRCHSTAFDAAYGDAAGYRRAFMRASWPHVGGHVKRYVRDGFTSELADRPIEDLDPEPATTHTATEGDRHDQHDR